MVSSMNNTSVSTKNTLEEIRMNTCLYFACIFFPNQHTECALTVLVLVGSKNKNETDKKCQKEYCSEMVTLLETETKTYEMCVVSVDIDQ